MNTFINRGVKSILAVLFISVSIIPVHAQGWKKGIQNLPKALGKKPPLTGTAPVVRLPVTPRVPPTLPNAVVSTPRVAPVTAAVEQKVAQATVQAQTAAQIPQPKDFLTGVQALQTFRPGWKSELMLSGFTRQQLDLVEQAFKETDQFLFETDEAGNWQSPRSAEWNYTARYTKILTDNAYGELALNDGQIKTLFGKFSRLDDVFTRLNEQSFIAVHKRAPKIGAPGEEGELARHAKYNVDKRHPKMNPEVEEYVYGNMPAKLKTPKPSYGPKARSAARTPEQVWEEVNQFMREHNGEIPGRTAKDDYERKLRKVWDTIYQRKQSSNDPYVQRLIKLHDETVRARANVKNPQEIYDYTTRFMREHNGKLPSEYSQDPVEKSYRKALHNFHQKYKNMGEEELEELNEVSCALEQLLRQEIREQAANKTSQEILDYMMQYLRKHEGRLPSEKSQNQVEKSYSVALRDFHKKYKDLTDAQVEELDEPDRTLEKLFRQEVKQYAAAKTPQEWLDIVEPWVLEHWRWPSQGIEEEKAMYMGAYRAIRNHPDDPASIRLKELKEKYQ